jgi:23S rRNA (adenine2030-N6)-methyltransferase
MNYRHAFHAGNHADVLKHVVLTRVLAYFKQKDARFAVLDAHAGIGSYDLTGVEAFKTMEWQGGIGRLLAVPCDVELEGLLAPYLNAVRAVNPDGVLRRYPGSPAIAQQLLRFQFRLLLNELHPHDFETLRGRYDGIANVQVTQLDAATAVKAALPFLERRGIVLIDPAFEVSDESQRVSRMVTQALKRMAHVCMLIWYPVTAQPFADAFCNGLDLRLAKSALRAELLVREAYDGGGLAGSGLVIVNPPWTLFDELQKILPALAKALGEGGQGRFDLHWLKPLS